MKDYSYDNIEKASEEAFRMQNNSKFFDEDWGRYREKCRFEKNEDLPSPKQNGNCSQKSVFSIDDDKILILALILILSKNCNDKFLMMALLYIIM